jgi:hypothetical protein
MEGDLAAALLYAGKDAVLSDATAAWWWGLVEQKPATIHVSVQHRRKSVRGVRVHERRPRTRVWHNRLPVATVAETLIDYAATAPLSRVRHALAEAEYRDLLDMDQIEAALGRGRRGSARVRQGLARHLPMLARTRSRVERAFLALCESAGLPIPEMNAIIGRMTIDAVWHRERVAVEIDGHRGHRTRAQLERDRRRELRLRAAGYTVLRYTEDQVLSERDLVVADLSAALRKAA